MPMRRKMMALVENGKPLEFRTAPIPNPKKDEVLIRTTFAGLCHSDLHQQDGFFNLGEDGGRLPLKRFQNLPCSCGHEIEGEVIAVGEEVNVDAVRIGMAVAVYPFGGCGQCADCAAGFENHCSANAKRNSVGNGEGIEGGFASHVLVPHYRYCFDLSGIPKGIGGIMMCSGLTAFSALKKLGHLSDCKDIVIIGLGGVGLQAYEFAKALLGGYPSCVDVRDEVLQALAADGDGSHAFNSNDSGAVHAIRKRNGGRGVAGVLDFVGSTSTFQLSSSIARKGATIIQVGLIGGSMAMPLALFPLRALSIQGSFTGEFLSFPFSHSSSSSFFFFFSKIFFF